MRPLILSALLALPSVALAQDTPTARATLSGADGAEVGTATLTETPRGLLIHVESSGLTEGDHGVHIHRTGACDPDFDAAGGHFNPAGLEHGLLVEGGEHAGDLPNIHVDAEGNAVADIYSTAVTLVEGAEHSLMDADGSALMIHGSADDYQSQDSAGDRVACGVIEAD